MAKYFLENVRASRPGARCAVAVGTRGAMIRDLLAAYPWIEVVEVNRRSPRALLSLMARFWRSAVVVTPYTGGRVGIFTKLFARVIARRLIGFTDSFPFNSFIYTSLIPLIGRARAPRLLECDALGAAGIPVAAPQLSFAYIPQPELLPRLGLTAGNYVVLHLFSGSSARGLSPARRRALIEELSRVMPAGFTLVLTGSEKERASLGTALPSNTISVSTSIQELAHLIDHSAGMVSLDTGAAHIAAHLKKPLVVLASCVGVQWWSEDMYGDSVPSKLFTCPEVCADGHDYSGYARCLDSIDAGEVVERARSLL